MSTDMLDSVHIELLLAGIKKHYEYFGYALESYSIEQGVDARSTIQYCVQCSEEKFERYVPMFSDEVPDISTDTLLNLAHFKETVSGKTNPHVWSINREAYVFKKSLSATTLK